MVMSAEDSKYLNAKRAIISAIKIFCFSEGSLHLKTIYAKKRISVKKLRDSLLGLWPSNLSVRKAQIRFLASLDMSLSSGKVSAFLWFIILL